MVLDSFFTVHLQESILPNSKKKSPVLAFGDMPSQVRGFTGARLGGVPLGWHFRFGGSQS
jgi:hypothetical protein